MKKALFIIVTIICLFSLLGISVYAFFWYSVLKMYITTPIAKNVEVNSEWRKIEIKSPLQIKKQVQKISLSLDGYKHNVDSDFEVIKLPDGTVLRPEIRIIDENNKEYPLKGCCRTGDSVEFALDKQVISIESLPRNVKYKAVLIRSDKPFKCDITWIDNDMK
jgi:hypothetical protein